jgi:hypothetical protein
VVVGLHGDSPPLPLELGTRQRCHRHRCHHSPYESASPVSVPTQRALVLSRLDPYAASIKLGPTTHHVDACSAWRNLMAATPKVHEPAVATSHLLGSQGDQAFKQHQSCRESLRHGWRWGCPHIQEATRRDLPRPGFSCTRAGDHYRNLLYIRRLQLTNVPMKPRNIL